MINKEFKCYNCDRNFFDYTIKPYSVLINGNVEFLCNDCISKFINEGRYYIRIIMDYFEYFDKGIRKKGSCEVYKGNIESIKQFSERLYNHLYEHILFKKDIDRNIIIEELHIFKNYKDKMCVTNNGIYPMFFFNIEYKKVKLEILNKKCSVCGCLIDTPNYFFKKDNQLSLVCRKCHDRVYGDDIK